MRPVNFYSNLPWRKSRLHRLTSFASAAALVFAAVSDCSQSKYCEGIGCISSVRIAVSLPPSLGILDVEVCRNGVCSRGAVDVSASGSCTPLQGNGAATVEACSPPNEPATLRINVLLHDQPEGADTYGVTVRERDRVLLQAEPVVTYEPVELSGPDCPPNCYTASVELP